MTEVTLEAPAWLPRRESPGSLGSRSSAFLKRTLPCTTTSWLLSQKLPTDQLAPMNCQRNARWTGPGKLSGTLTWLVLAPASWHITDSNVIVVSNIIYMPHACKLVMHACILRVGLLCTSCAGSSESI
jgi:hypothetical protein